MEGEQSGCGMVLCVKDFIMGGAPVMHALGWREYWCLSDPSLHRMHTPVPFYSSEECVERMPPLVSGELDFTSTLP